MSPEAIRSALVHRQCTILRRRQSGNRHVIPSKPTPAAERIRATMGLSLPTTPYQLDRHDNDAEPGCRALPDVAPGQKFELDDINPLHE